MSYDDNFRPKSMPERMAQRKAQVDKSSSNSSSSPSSNSGLNSSSLPPADPVLTDDISSQPLPNEGARAGDNMIDRPKSLPKPLSISADCAVDSPYSSDEGGGEVNIDDLLHRSAINTHGLFRSSFWMLALVLVLALLLLYVSSHAISILHDALALPAPGRWVAIGFLIVLVGIIGYVIVRAAYFTVHLSRGSQLSIEQLVSVGDLTGLRSYRLASEEFLKPYLRGLIGRPKKTLEKFLQMSDADSIIESANRLLDPDRRLGSREWVNEFIDKIQLPMEALAVERINGYARAAAVKTAISPWPLVDMASIIYNSTLMLTDLAIIFNRRFSRGNTIRILMGMFFSIFIAGQAQEAVNAIENELGQGLTSGGTDPGGIDMDEHVSSLAESAFEHVGNGALLVAKFSTKKVVEGAANWLLMKRLGRRAVKMLKPIA